MYYILYCVEPEDYSFIEELEEMCHYDSDEHMEKIYKFESVKDAEECYKSLFRDSDAVIRDLIKIFWNDTAVRENLQEGYRMFLKQDLYDATEEEFRLLLSGLSFTDANKPGMNTTSTEMKVDGAIVLWHIDIDLEDILTIKQYFKQSIEYGTWIKKRFFSFKSLFKELNAERVCSNFFQFDLNKGTGLDILNIQRECEIGMLFAQEKLTRIEKYKTITNIAESKHKNLLIDYRYKDIDYSILKAAVWRDWNDVQMVKKTTFHVIDDRHILVIPITDSNKTGAVFVWDVEEETISHLSNGNYVLDACVSGQYLYTFSQVYHRGLPSYTEIHRYDYGIRDLNNEGILLEQFSSAGANGVSGEDYIDLDYYDNHSDSERYHMPEYWEETTPEPLLNIRMFVENGILYVKRILSDYTLAAIPVDKIPEKSLN